MNITVIGAGSWGTAVASICATNGNVRLWARDEELAAHINTHHENDRYLAGVSLPKHIVATSVLQDALGDADVVIMGVPSHGFRAVLSEIRPLVNSSIPIISLSKGVEQGTLMRMTEVIADVLPDHDTAKIGVLTGPNLAREIAAGMPASTVVAMENQTKAKVAQKLLNTPTFRVYTHDDVIGVELGGVVKNVIAIATGISDGLELGSNARSALITRGLAEIVRLGTAMGGKIETFIGLSGMGDLILTCSDNQSRNRRMGLALGEGKDIAAAEAAIGQVVEGKRNAELVLQLAEKYGVEMPICETVWGILQGKLVAKDAAEKLLARTTKSERMVL